jgi:hypothetical protein
MQSQRGTQTGTHPTADGAARQSRQLSQFRGIPRFLTQSTAPKWDADVLPDAGIVRDFLIRRGENYI